jgi:hypothetical protein
MSSRKIQAIAGGGTQFDRHCFKSTF